MTNKLVTSNRKRKPGLDREQQPSIKPTKTFSMEELEETTTKPGHETVEVAYTPMPTSIKVDTDIRNIVNALSLIGAGESQREVIYYALLNMIEGLSEEKKREYDVFYKSLHQRELEKLKKQS